MRINLHYKITKPGGNLVVNTRHPFGKTWLGFKMSDLIRSSDRAAALGQSTLEVHPHPLLCLLPNGHLRLRGLAPPRGGRVIHFITMLVLMLWETMRTE